MYKTKPNSEMENKPMVTKEREGGGGGANQVWDNNLITRHKNKQQGLTAL